MTRIVYGVLSERFPAVLTRLGEENGDVGRVRTN